MGKVDCKAETFVFCFSGLSVVAPELAVPGKTTAVLVTIHGPAGQQSLNVSLKLHPAANDETSLETIQEVKGMFCIV